MKALSLLPLLFLGQSLAEIPRFIARPATQNQFSPGNTSDISGESIQGGIFADHNHANVPKSAGIHLTEASFGNAFATYLSPYPTFTNDTLGPIWATLYPPGYGQPGGVTATRSAIEGSTLPFRYKYLLYGTSAEDNSIAILDLFEASNNPGQWFGQTERDAIIAEIAKLRVAIAQDPLNIHFQDALLEIYYDWAVGESQLSKQLLSILARVRLGLVSDAASPFIIDLEISTYEQLVENTERILDVYKDLLSMRVDGVNPSDFDPNAGNSPYGYYIFQTRVPQRRQTPSQYATDTGTEMVLPNDPGQFTGYKDYRTLLTFVGQYIEYQAELARFRGIRNAPGDITDARNDLTQVQDQAALATLLGGMFTNPDGSPVDFNDPNLDETGVRGAKFYIESSLAKVADSRSYLNGQSNHLGVDPNFLLLLPSEGPEVTPMNEDSLATGLFDTYDLLHKRLTQRTQGMDPIGPLAIAADDFANAKTAFEEFQANVGNIGDQLSDITSDFNDDFERLTGYGPEIQDQFNGFTPNLAGASELKSANTRIEDLSRRNLDIIAINNQILAEIAEAQEAVTVAMAIEGKITGAESNYLTNTAAAWTEIHVWAGTAAAAAGAYQTLADVAGADISSKPLQGALIGAGVLNTAIQTAAAVRTSMREQEIEEAAIAFEVALAVAPLELEVKQAQMVVSSLNRDLLSNLLEINDNNAALAQAVAERTAILREVQILQRNIESDFASLSSSYFADPIFFIRAERETLKADASFRNAQRWMFYTCRALEYKWQQKFAWAEGGNTFDIGSILSARNYEELEDIRQHMASVDGLRRLGSGASLPSTTVISLRDQFITPNPDDPNLTFGAIPDTGERYSASRKIMVSKVDHFREILKRDHIVGGNIVIDFNTSILQNFNGNFFLGPNFSGIPQSGNYRNKIVWTAVHMLKDGSEGEVTLKPASFSGVLEYGGQSYFRTRVPVDPALRTPASNDFDVALDFPGAYVTAPVRYFEDTLLNGNYTMFDTVRAGHQIAESSTSAFELTSPTRAAMIDPANGFRNGLLKERAVAASRLTLQINVNPPTEANARSLIDQLDDIEILIQHQSYTRARISD